MGYGYIISKTNPNSNMEYSDLFVGLHKKSKTVSI